MYQIQFLATTSADWTAAVELIDANTNLPLEGVTDAEFELQVDDGCGNSYLNASTTLGTITTPASNVVQWHFPKSNLSSLNRGRTYNVGLTMTDTEGTIQIFIGTLTFVDGVVGS